MENRIFVLNKKKICGYYWLTIISIKCKRVFFFIYLSIYFWFSYKTKQIKTRQLKKITVP